jgi:hypothetical protein
MRNKTYVFDTFLPYAVCSRDEKTFKIGQELNGIFEEVEIKKSEREASQESEK